MIKQYRTAIVTGASRGLGVYIARALAQEGMNLVLAARTASALDQVAEELKAAGARVITVPTDLSDREALIRLVAAAESEFGAVDVLVNNAALDSAMPYHKENPEKIEEILQINLAVPMILTRLVLPGMLQRRRGHIVNFSALVAKIPFPYESSYAASKAGLTHFTASLRAECRGTGVSASSILAGAFRSEGLAEKMLKETGVVKPSSVPTSPPEAAGQAVVRAIKNDLAEVAIPAPAILFTQIPRLGTLFFNATRINDMIGKIAEVRGSTA